MIGSQSNRSSIDFSDNPTTSEVSVNYMTVDAVFSGGYIAWDAGNTGVNIPPVAQDQVVKSLEDNIVEFNVNGVDSRGGILLYTIVVKPTNGIARLIGSNIVYSPNSNVFGIDSLKFKVNNGFLESDAATVTLMIDSVNDAPTAQSQSVSVRNGIASEIKLVGNDVEGSPLTYTVDSRPTKGTLTGAGAIWTYTPNISASGTDMFSFYVSDGTLTSSPAQVSLIISDTNSPSNVELIVGSLNQAVEGSTIKIPVTVRRFDNVTSANFTLQWDPKVLNFLAVQDFSLNGMTIRSFNTNLHSVGTMLVAWDDPDSFGSSLRDNSKIFDVSFRVIGLSGENSIVKFMGFPSSREVAVKAVLVESTFVNGLVTVGAQETVTNSPPIAISQKLTTQEDVSIGFYLTATNSGSDVLDYKITTPAGNGVLTGKLPNIVYTPNPDFNGEDFFIFKVSDGKNGAFSFATISISVKPVNDPPAALAQYIDCFKDTSKRIVLQASDIDKNKLEFSIGDKPAHGTITGMGSRIVYTPNPDFVGYDRFDFTVWDGFQLSRPAVVLIRVQDLSFQHSEKITFKAEKVLVDSSARTVTVPISLLGVTNISSAKLLLEWDAKILNFDRAELLDSVSAGLVASFDLLSVSNGRLGFYCEVENSAFPASEKGSGIFNLVFNISNHSASNAIISFSNLKENSELSVNNNLVGFRFENGEVVFSGESIKFNDKPRPISQFVSINEDQSKWIFLLADKATDGILKFRITELPKNGVITGEPPILRFTPNKDWSGMDSFKFIIDDGVSEVHEEGSVAITVLPVNDRPVGLGQSIVTAKGTSKEIYLSAADSDNKFLIFDVVAGPKSGSFTIDGNRVVYTPGSDFVGFDSFKFTSSDGVSQSEECLISIQVMGFTSIPVARSQSFDGAQGDTVTISLDGSDPMGLPLSYFINVQPAFGKIAVDGFLVIYTPDPEFVGNDSFIYSVSNGLRSSSSAIVNISIKPTLSTHLSVGRVDFDSNKIELKSACGKGLKRTVESSTNLFDWKYEAVFIGNGLMQPVKINIPLDRNASSVYWRIR